MTCPHKQPQSWTRHDIYHAAFLLRQKLPAELVPEILNHAEYWLKSSVSRDAMVSVTQHSLRPSSEGHAPTGLPYLSTKPIGMDGLTGLHPVQKVVFTINSKDQGHSWDSAWHGTYEHSWTWFEATVEENGASVDLGFEEGEGRRITTNIHAGREYKTQVIIWTEAGEKEEKWVRGLKVRGLKRGQVITLRAWARFPGWQNNVNSATIDVYTSAVR